LRPERVVALAFASFAVYLAVLTAALAADLRTEYKTPGAAISLSFAIPGSIIFYCVAIAALGLGIWLLRLAFGDGQDAGAKPARSWVKVLLVSIGCFFPGLLLSVPLALWWAANTWPGDGQSPLAAFEPSLILAGMVVVVCSVLLLRKHNIQRNSDNDRVSRNW
jgi:hypothetical protein